jgi:hypothetical protein
LLCCSLWFVQLTSAQGIDESFSQMLGATYNVLVLFLNYPISFSLVHSYKLHRGLPPICSRIDTDFQLSEISFILILSKLK